MLNNMVGIEHQHKLRLLFFIYGHPSESVCARTLTLLMYTDTLCRF